VLDDATLSRSEQVFGKDLEWIEVYERQLPRWQTLPLTAEQPAEVRRIAGELAPWRAILQMTLELAAELKHGTIDAIMRTDGHAARFRGSPGGSAPFRKPLGEGLRRHVAQVHS
jgi:hypothetical protein